MHGGDDDGHDEGREKGSKFWRIDHKDEHGQNGCGELN